MTGFATRGWGTSRILSGKVCRTQLDRASSTTLTNVPNCGHYLQAGATYIIEARITGVSTTNGGAKAAIAGDGALSATLFTLRGANSNNATTNAVSTTTTLGNAVGASTAVMTDMILLGSIVVNAGGVAWLQFAQNASSVDISSAYVGSYVKFTRVY